MSYPPPHHGHYRPAPPVSPGPYQPQSPAGYSPPTQQYAPQPQPYMPPPAYGPPMMAAPMVAPTSGWATASLVFGLLGLFGGWCMIGIPCVLAVLAGHIGLQETKTGHRGGRGMAVAGLILGYLVVIPAAIIFFGVVATPRN